MATYKIEGVDGEFTSTTDAVEAADKHGRKDGVDRMRLANQLDFYGGCTVYAPATEGGEWVKRYVYEVGTYNESRSSSTKSFSKF